MEDEIDQTTACLDDVRQRITAALDQVPRANWDNLFRRLRGVIDDIDETVFPEVPDDD